MAETWCSVVTLDDIYHQYLLVTQGPLKDTLTKLHFLGETTGAVIKVFALRPSAISAGADSFYRKVAEAGMLCEEVGRINRDYSFDSWRAAIPHVWRDIPKEQALAELQNLQNRLSLEMEALRIQEELTTQADATQKALQEGGGHENDRADHRPQES